MRFLRNLKDAPGGIVLVLGDSPSRVRHRSQQPVRVVDEECPISQPVGNPHQLTELIIGVAAGTKSGILHPHQLVARIPRIGGNAAACLNFNQSSGGIISHLFHKPVGGMPLDHLRGSIIHQRRHRPPGWFLPRGHPGDGIGHSNRLIEPHALGDKTTAGIVGVIGKPARSTNDAGDTSGSVAHILREPTIGVQGFNDIPSSIIRKHLPTRRMRGGTGSLSGCDSLSRGGYSMRDTRPGNPRTGSTGAHRRLRGTV